MNKYIIILGLLVFASSIAQVILKISANHSYSNKFKELFNYKVIIAYFIMFIAMILTTLYMKYVEYKLIPIIESLGYIYIMALSALILKEKVSKRMKIGNMLIILGIIIFNL
jgi:drug/metabolite transporter (DMT)-like permease